MQGLPALSVRGLGKRFGDRAAFENVSFEIGYGEVFGFLGPNGAWKATTVRTLGTSSPRPPARPRSPESHYTGEWGRDPPPDRDHA